MQQKHLLVAACIIIMWVAVLFVGVFGSDIVNEGVTDRQEVPVVAAVALFAMIASAVVGWAGFRE